MAAPFATRQLADLGARVIKIERPGTRRFRARVRHDGQGPVELLRLAQPIEGVADARSQAAGRRRRARRGCSRARTCSSRTSRPAPPIGSARRRGSARALSATHRLLRFRLRHRRVRTPTARRTTCSCRARSACCRSPAPRTRRRRSASRSPTSPPACTRSPASSRRSSRAPRTGAARIARRLAVRRARASGWARRRHYTAYGGAAPPRSGPASRVDRAVRAGRDARRRGVYLGIQNAREWTRFCADVLRPAGAGRRTRASRRIRCASTNRAALARGDREPSPATLTGGRADRAPRRGAASPTRA